LYIGCVKSNEVIIVAGLKRGGTSLIMQMLDMGGVEVVVDEMRDADQFNPYGYYEHQTIMDFNRKNPKPYSLNFLEGVKGKAIKVYAGLLQLLPKAANLHYKVLFVERDIFEVWTSRRKMNPQIEQKGNDKIIFFAIRQRENLKRVIENVKFWTNTREDVETLWLNYATVIEKPEQEAKRIRQFLNDMYRIDLNAMTKAVDPNSYNEKATQLFLSTDRSPKAVAQLIDQYATGKIYCEIGIGEGHNLHLVKTPKHKFGIERTPYGVKRCKELYPELEVIQGDFFKIYKNHPFEVCFLWIVYPYCKKFVDAIYPEEAQAAHWNNQINEHLQELNAQGFTHHIEAVRDDNGEIFSVAIVQKKS